MRLLVLWGCVWAMAANAQTITTIFNAASLGAGVPNNSLAPGSLATLQLVRGQPGTGASTVFIKPRGGITLQAPILESAITSYTILIPQETPLGDADIVASLGGQDALPVPVHIVPVALGLFQKNATAFSKPARPGEYITLWATGLGNATAADLTIEIAGRPYTPSYAGHSTQYPGLDQINVPLGVAVPESCFTAVQAFARGSASNPITIATAASEAVCEDAFGLSADELRRLDQGQPVRVPVVSIRSEVMPSFGVLPGGPVTYVRNEAISAEFAQRSADDLRLIAQPYYEDEFLFGCRTYNTALGVRFTLSDNFDAGEVLKLSGPNGDLDVPHPGVPVLYLSVLPEKPADQLPFFSGGLWTLTAPGGRTTAPFTVPIQTPPPLRWLNRTALSTINRGNDTTIEWAADGYGYNDLMSIYLTSAASFDSPANSIACRVPATARRVVIPASLLKDLTNSPVGQLQLRLSPRPDRRDRFDLPLTTGGTEHGVIDYQFTDTLRVAIR